jgi:hypothetical protein
MARGKPAAWSTLLALPFIQAGLFLYLADTQYPNILGAPIFVFGVFIFLGGVYVQYVGPVEPRFREDEELIDTRHPTQRVALSQIAFSTPFLIITIYLLVGTRLPYVYPTITFLVGLYLFSSGLRTYWANTLTTYYVTDRRVIRSYRFISQNRQEIPLDKIRGIQERKSVLEVLAGLGNIQVASGPGGDALTIVIRHIENSNEFADELRNLI